MDRRVRPPRWLRWAAVTVVAGIIFYASVLDSPGSGIAPLGPLGLVGMDKWLHALAYAALAGTLAVALAPGRTPAVVAALAAGSAIGYGAGIEVVQAPLAARYFSVVDMVANAVGAGVGVLGWWGLVGVVGRPEWETQSKSGS